MKEGNGEEMLQLAGEAYLMRGYLHFLLANLYGQPYTVSGAPQTKAVPVKLDLDLESVLGRSTLAHVYESVLADIEKARTLITKQTWDSAHMYRFSTLSVSWPSFFPGENFQRGSVFRTLSSNMPAGVAETISTSLTEPS